MRRVVLATLVLGALVTTPGLVSRPRAQEGEQNRPAAPAERLDEDVV